jgi:hypothetical protein
MDESRSGRALLVARRSKAEHRRVLWHNLGSSRP